MRQVKSYTRGTKNRSDTVIIKNSIPTHDLVLHLRGFSTWSECPRKPLIGAVVPQATTAHAVQWLKQIRPDKLVGEERRDKKPTHRPIQRKNNSKYFSVRASDGVGCAMTTAQTETHLLLFS